jgi:hypothetical protein
MFDAGSACWGVGEVWEIALSSSVASGSSLMSAIPPSEANEDPLTPVVKSQALNSLLVQFILVPVPPPFANVLDGVGEIQIYISSGKGVKGITRSLSKSKFHHNLNPIKPHQTRSTHGRTSYLD